MKSAENAYREGNISKAMADFQVAGALEEKDGDGMLLRRAEIFYENKDFESARNELEGAVRSGSHNAQIYLMLGRIETAAEDFQKADGYFEKAYELEPKSGNLTARVKSLARGGSFGKALEVLNTSGDNGEEAAYYRNLVRFGSSGEAMDLNYGAGSRYKDSIYLMADFYDQQGNGNPDYIAVKKADIFNKLDEPDFAYALLREVLGKNPSYCDALITLGKTYMIEDDYRKAADSMERCTAGDANYREAFFWLSGIYERLGDAEKAKEYRDRYAYLVK